MTTKRTRIDREMMRTELSEDEMRWLIDARGGPYLTPFASERAERLAWQTHRDMLIQRRIKARPGTRPARWWNEQTGTPREAEQFGDCGRLMELGETTPEEEQRALAMAHDQWEERERQRAQVALALQHEPKAVREPSDSELLAAWPWVPELPGDTFAIRYL